MLPSLFNKIKHVKVGTQKKTSLKFHNNPWSTVPKQSFYPLNIELVGEKIEYVIFLLLQTA